MGTKIDFLKGQLFLLSRKITGQPCKSFKYLSGNTHLLGMIIRSLMTDFIVSKTLIVQRISIILFMIVFISIWVEEWDRIISFITRAGLVALILNIVMIFIGYYTAKYFTSGV